jgi:predicted nucleotidyltransferase
VDIGAALGRLVAAADDGRLAAVCAQHDVQLVTVFGSAVRDPGAAHDLDVAVLFGRRGPLAPLQVVDALFDLTGTEAIDLLVLDDAEPAARFNGLVGAVPLFEDEPGRWARTQMAAAGEVFDTEWMRRAELERMASS